MKKINYQKPEAELLHFCNEDIITTSGWEWVSSVDWDCKGKGMGEYNTDTGTAIRHGTDDGGHTYEWSDGEFWYGWKK